MGTPIGAALAAFDSRRGRRADTRHTALEYLCVDLSIVVSSCPRARRSDWIGRRGLGDSEKNDGRRAHFRMPGAWPRRRDVGKAGAAAFCLLQPSQQNPNTWKP